MRLSPCVLVQPDGWARGEREGYGGPRGVTSLSLSLSPPRRVPCGVQGPQNPLVKVKTGAADDKPENIHV